MVNKKMFFCLLPLITASCSTTYYNKNIKDPSSLERQRVIDEGYCTRVSVGSVPMPEIRQYQSGVQNYNITGTVRTQSSNGLNGNGSYNSYISSSPNAGESFSNGLASGASVGAAFRASLERDKVFKGCMYNLGWTTDKPVESLSSNNTSDFLSLAIKTANENNDPKIQTRIAYAYIEGKDTPRDIDKAIYWLTKASEQGYKDASIALYVIYAGVYVKGYENSGLMIRYLTKASEQGDADAQNMLASLYYKGEIVPKDHSKSLELYKKSCQQNDAISCAQLASMFAMGQGEKKSLIASYILFNKSVRLGNSDAIKSRDYVGNMLGKEDLSKAKIAQDIIY